MKKIILFISCVFCFEFSNGQAPVFEWAKSMGSAAAEFGQSISIDKNGNVYTTGLFEGVVDFDPGAGIFNITSTGGDVFISKLDAYGNFVWAKSISSGWGYAIATDTMGSVYTTGFFSGTVDFDPGVGTFNLTSSPGKQNIFISKLDTDGNFVWAKAIVGTSTYSEGYSIALDKIGNVYTTGYFNGIADFDPGLGTFDLTSANSDVFILKLDVLGNFVWAKSFGGASYEYGQSISIDSMDNIYTTGWFNGTADFDPNAGTFNLTLSGSSSTFVSKLDVNGNFVWAKNIDGTLTNQGYSIVIDKMSNVYTTGWFQGTIDLNPGLGTFNLSSTGLDIFIFKLDSLGNFVWAKSIGGLSTDVGRAIALDNMSNVYTIGSFQDVVDFNPGAGILDLTAIGSSDIFILKLDSLGNFIWAKNIGNTIASWSRAITTDAFGSIYATGCFNETTDFDPDSGISELTSVGASDIFVLKLSQPPTGINESINSNNISIYPNPNKGIFNVYVPLQLNNGSIEVYNRMGALVYKQEIVNQENSIELANQTHGLYFVKVMSENKIVGTGKIIKE